MKNNIFNTAREAIRQFFSFSIVISKAGNGHSYGGQVIELAREMNVSLEDAEQILKDRKAKSQ